MKRHRRPLDLAAERERRDDAHALPLLPAAEDSRIDLFKHRAHRHRTRERKRRFERLEHPLTCIRHLDRREHHPKMIDNCDPA